HFLGRRDHQVKLRGFRIELAEVESALAQHEAVQQVVVLLRHDPPLAPRLVAYLVLTPQRSTTPAHLRAFLKAHLPDYMLPATYLFLPQLPLSANGKLDRQALPAPTPETSATAEA